MTRAVAWAYCPAKVADSRHQTLSISTDQARTSFAPARGLAAALDYAVGSHRRAAALLLAFSLVAFLPGFFQIPPLDRDEARFAQATKQMLETHEYVDIRFQDEVRYKKPVGIYWLQAAGAHAHLALSPPIARRCDIRRPLDVLGSACLRWPSRRSCRCADDGELGHARRRGAPRQDRRDAVAHLRRSDGGNGAHLSGEP